MRWLEDKNAPVAIAIIFAVVVFGWMFRFEMLSGTLGLHKNRFTGSVYHIKTECWFSDD